MIVNDNSDRPGRAGRLPAIGRGWLGLRCLAWGLAVVCALAVGPAFAASFTASLDREVIQMGETATLSLRFDGVSPASVPSPSAISNLQIQYIGPSSQHSIINGQVSSSVTYIFSLTPRQPGDFTIPPLTAEVQGQRLTTPALNLKVVRPGSPSQEAINSGSQLVFLKLTLPKKEVYLGEVITAELQFYFRQGVQLAGQPHLTATPAEGFSLGRITSGQQRQVQVGNAVYTLLPATIALKAIKSGPLTVGPITSAVVIQVPSPNRRRNTIFDQFGLHDPFNSGERQQISVATDTVGVQSLPLPAENIPAGFDGAVGSYTLTTTVGPTNVTAGDPITVRVQITGRGALDALNLPVQAAWSDFKSYPPTAKVETTDALGLQGTKTFEQVVTPENSDIKQLPAFSFSFFDPEAKQYRTLTQPAVPLVVRPGGATPTPVIAANSKFATAAPPPRQDIVHIKPRPGSLAQISPPLILQPWFVAVQGVPVLAWLVAVGWRKRVDALANNPRRRRQRQVAQVIQSGLVELRRLATANQPEDFFATLFRLLQEQLGERLDCPASAITEAIVDEKLRPRGLAETTLGELHELFQACNLARYAPTTSGQELTALIPRLEGALREIQGMKP